MAKGNAKLAGVVRLPRGILSHSSLCMFFHAKAQGRKERRVLCLSITNRAVLYDHLSFKSTLSFDHRSVHISTCFPD
jgi:hypothetical protein